MATRHLIVYLKWDTLLKWKQQCTSNRLNTSGLENNNEFPYAYGSDQIRFLNLVRPKDVVWVICSPRFGKYLLPPSLVARLRVNKIIDQTTKNQGSYLLKIPEASIEWNYIVLADRQHSKYFPINNAYETLRSLTFIGNRPKLDPESCDHCQKLIKEGKGLYAGIPGHFQTIRELAPSSVSTIENFGKEVSQGHMVFLSYRRSEANENARELLINLQSNGFYCWLDTSAIPPDVAIGKQTVDDNVLKETLNDGIRQSTLFVALVTPRYYKSKWTKLEWENAEKQLNETKRGRPILLVEVMLGGESTKSGKDITRLDGSNIKRTALEIKKIVSHE